MERFEGSCVANRVITSAHLSAGYTSGDRVIKEQKVTASIMTVQSATTVIKKITQFPNYSITKSS